MRKRILYSQNFLRSRDLISKLLDIIEIDRDDTVLEIGVGEGIITNELLGRCKKIIAYEIDDQLFEKLSDKFRKVYNLELIKGNFLDQLLPGFSYKIFSNIPFNITSSIIKKLTLASNPPEDSYLIVQKEAAIKFIGKPLDIKNSQISVLLYPFFEFKIIYNFDKKDFFPSPNVEVVLLRIKKRKEPLINKLDINTYRDFVSHKFIRSKVSQLNFTDWINIFNQFVNLSKYEKDKVAGSYQKLLIEQDRLEKVHRTRLDKNWKRHK